MSDLKLWYDAPASVWTEALPIGNGRLGAMIFGGVAPGAAAAQRGYALGRWSLFAGQSGRAAHLDEVRGLLFAGRYAEAEALSDRHLMAKPLKQMPYQPAADLWIETSLGGEIEAGTYRRSLDLSEAVASTQFRVAGVTVTREAFATAADGVIVVRIRADRPGASHFGSV